MNEKYIYLASQSERRSQLLHQIGIAHQLLLPEAHEDSEALEAVRAGEAPQDYVQRVTRLKLDAAVARRERLGLDAAPILCADTTVALDGQILGKPEDAMQAHAMLRSLAGRGHSVCTAIALHSAGRCWQALSVSQVLMAPMDEAQIAAYVATGEPMGKAGAYAIQGRMAAWVQEIRGSHSGIVGLPLFETAQLLRRAGWLP